MLSIVRVIACAALVTAGSGRRALAQSWPTKPIRWVVPFAAGGSTDLSARVMAENLRPILGQPIIIDNRAGAAGTIAGDTVAKATPDGYTFLVASATLVANMSLYKNLPYDFIRDLAPVSQMYFSTNVLVVNRKVPVNNLAEFIAYVKDGKNTVHYGTAGHGSSQHLAAALFNQMVGGNMVHVPYKGGAPAITGPRGRLDRIDLLTAHRSAAPHQVGRAQTARCLRLPAVADRARHAAHQRAPAGLPLDIVERHLRAGEDTVRHRQQDESGAPENADRAGSPDALRRIGQGAGGQLTGGIQEVRRGRSRASARAGADLGRTARLSSFQILSDMLTSEENVNG